MKFFRNQKNPYDYQKLFIEGTLTVSDDTLSKNADRGSWKEKAYGFGLMTVVPLEE